MTNLGLAAPQVQRWFSRRSGRRERQRSRECGGDGTTCQPRAYLPNVEGHEAATHAAAHYVCLPCHEQPLTEKLYTRHTTAAGHGTAAAKGPAGRVLVSTGRLAGLVGSTAAATRGTAAADGTAAPSPVGQVARAR